jgi:hypothetical protein
MERPADAQLSPDGHYWWDTTSQEWQLVDDSSGQSAESAATPAEDEHGDAQAEVAIAGECLTCDLSESDIEQILAAAGASIEADA